MKKYNTTATAIQELMDKYGGDYDAIIFPDEGKPAPGAGYSEWAGPDGKVKFYLSAYATRIARKQYSIIPDNATLDKVPSREEAIRKAKKEADRLLKEQEAKATLNIPAQKNSAPIPVYGSSFNGGEKQQIGWHTSTGFVETDYGKQIAAESKALLEKESARIQAEQEAWKKVYGPLGVNGIRDRLSATLRHKELMRYAKTGNKALNKAIRALDKKWASKKKDTIIGTRTLPALSDTDEALYWKERAHLVSYYTQPPIATYAVGISNEEFRARQAILFDSFWGKAVPHPTLHEPGYEEYRATYNKEVNKLLTENKRYQSGGEKNYSVPLEYNSFQLPADPEHPSFVSFDIETSGLDPATSSTLGIAAVRYTWNPFEKRYVITDVFDRYYYAKGGAEEYFRNGEAISVSKYDKERVDQLRSKSLFKYSKYFDDKELTTFLNWIDKDKVVGQNITGFDIPYLFGRTKMAADLRPFFEGGIVDATHLFRTYRGRRFKGQNTLDTVFKEVFGLTMEEAGLPHHHALSDSIALAKILIELSQESGYLGNIARMALHTPKVSSEEGTMGEVKQTFTELINNKGEYLTLVDAIVQRKIMSDLGIPLKNRSILNGEESEMAHDMEELKSTVDILGTIKGFQDVMNKLVFSLTGLQEMWSGEHAASTVPKIDTTWKKIWLRAMKAEGANRWSGAETLFSVAKENAYVMGLGEGKDPRKSAEKIQKSIKDYASWADFTSHISTDKGDKVSETDKKIYERIKDADALLYLQQGADIEKEKSVDTFAEKLKKASSIVEDFTHVLNKVGDNHFWTGDATRQMRVSQFGGLMHDASGLFQGPLKLLQAPLYSFANAESLRRQSAWDEKLADREAGLSYLSKASIGLGGLGAIVTKFAPVPQAKIAGLAMMGLSTIPGLIATRGNIEGQRTLRKEQSGWEALRSQVSNLSGIAEVIAIPFKVASAAVSMFSTSLFRLSKSMLGWFSGLSRGTAGAVVPALAFTDYSASDLNVMGRLADKMGGVNLVNLAENTAQGLNLAFAGMNDNFFMGAGALGMSALLSNPADFNKNLPLAMTQAYNTLMAHSSGPESGTYKGFATSLFGADFLKLVNKWNEMSEAEKSKFGGQFGNMWNAQHAANYVGGSGRSSTNMQAEVDLGVARKRQDEKNKSADTELTAATQPIVFQFEDWQNQMKRSLAKILKGEMNVNDFVNESVVGGLQMLEGWGIHAKEGGLLENWQGKLARLAVDFVSFMEPGIKTILTWFADTGIDMGLNFARAIAPWIDDFFDRIAGIEFNPLTKKVTTEESRARKKAEGNIEAWTRNGKGFYEEMWDKDKGARFVEIGGKTYEAQSVDDLIALLAVQKAGMTSESEINKFRIANKTISKDMIPLEKRAGRSTEVIYGKDIESLATTLKETVHKMINADWSLKLELSITEDGIKIGNKIFNFTPIATQAKDQFQLPGANDLSRKTVDE